MADITPPDFESDLGLVRALIPDIEPLDNPVDPTQAPEYLFSDGHLIALLGLNGGSIRLAAADACDVLGTSEGLISKVITTEDLKTDGAKLMAQFLARAVSLRKQAADTDALVEDFIFLPTLVPCVYPPQFVI